MTRPYPQWHADAKLGIFIHWGIYTIPAYAPRGHTINEVMKLRPDDGWAWLPYTEWYPNSVRFPDSPAAHHHHETWGDRPYETFRAPFEEASQAFKADDWAQLIADAGARYAVLVTKHHDGYCLWPSAVENPHRPGWRSQRDFVGEFADALRARGLTFGAYYSGGLDWTFRHTPIGTFADLLDCVPFEDDYRAYALAQYRELIDRYQPDVLWNDIAYPDEGDREALFADYFAKRPEGVTNDRWLANRGVFEWVRTPAGKEALNERVKAKMATEGGEAMGDDSGLGDYHTPEYSAQLEFGRPWESCRGIDKSFAFNRQARPEDHLTPDELIRSFVDIVAHGGNLLLNMGPQADGSLPDVQRKVLLALGVWMKRNGEAIYGTRRTNAPKGEASDATPYRLTTKDGVVYALLMGAPREGAITFPTIRGASAARRLDGGPVRLEAGSDAAAVTLGAPFDKNEPVHVIAFEGAPTVS